MQTSTRRRNGIIGGLAALAVALLPAAPALGASGPDTLPDRQGATAAPLVGAGDATAVDGRYIVVFDKGTSRQDLAAARADARAKGATVHHDYTAALQGFSATLNSRALDALRRNPNVAYVEADKTVTASTTQSPATWGLDRIDQRNLPLDNSYTYTPTGAGVDAYIIDTGIRSTHSQFGGRVQSGYTAISDGNGTEDCNGHGTHVAGTVGGSTYGVAKGVALYPVRVLDCNGSGTTSGVIAGVDWVTNNHSGPSVANMSLGGSASTSLDTAVSNSIASGVSYSVAAGNDNRDACSYSPARVSTALTVGSTTSTDARSSFSNYGSCLDVFAPGSDITSSWYTSDTATNTISGTSMATPHVTGVTALYLQNNPTASPSAVADAVVSTSTTNVISNVGTGSPNRLVYSPLTGGTEPPPSGCALPETYTGSLSGSGDYDYQPNGTYYYSAASGTHHGCLDGPTGTDFDLYLYKWNGSSWQTVASGLTSSPDEDVTYTGTSGYYLWKVYSYSGSGSYTFSMQRP